MKIQCWNCENPIEVDDEQEEILYCKYCGKQINLKWTEKEEEDLRVASKQRNLGNFKTAEKLYTELIGKLAGEHKKNMVRWERLLNKYGVIYMDKDDGSEEYHITCRLNVNSDIREEKDFKICCEDSALTFQERSKMQDDAEYIASIQQKIKEKIKKQYDVFICYKETEPGRRNRTVDSATAKLVYDKLQKEGFRVFFSRESLKDSAGANYESAIFSALHNAKVMLLIGSQKSYLESKWVKSEWERYLKLKEQDSSKEIIPLYKGTSAIIPQVLDKTQGIDLDTDINNNFELLLDNLYRITKKTKNLKLYERNTYAQEYVKKGLQEYAEENYEEAKDLFLVASKQGNTDANFYLGSMYFSIESMQDVPKSFECFREAAYGQHIVAMDRLAVAYEFGFGVNENKTKARMWKEEADKLRNANREEV